MASHTPPTAEPLAARPPLVSDGASAVSATMLSQSPRLDRDSAIHSRRNGLIDSTPGFAGMVAPRSAAPGLPPVGAAPVAPGAEVHGVKRIGTAGRIIG